MINYNSTYLMMVEPNNHAELPILDNYTKMAEVVLAHTEEGTRYRGVHRCACGQTSGNCNLHITGKTTNSLLVHYVKEHRSFIPIEELQKLQEVFTILSHSTQKNLEQLWLEINENPHSKPQNLKLREKLKVFRTYQNISDPKVKI